MNRPTVRDVAERAGVSIATVSRALSDQDVVSVDTRERVLEAAADLNYHVNGHARSLRSARSNTIGLLVSDIRNPFFAELAHVIQTDLARRGYATFIGSASEDRERQDAYLASLMEQRIDGVILSPQSDESQSIRRMIDLKLPIVFVDRTVPDLGIASVDSDPSQGIREALEALSGVGWKTVGFVAGPMNTSTGRDRLAEFEYVADEVFPPDHVRVAYGGYSESQVNSALDLLLDQGVDALIFGYSPNAISALRELRRRGLVPGRDIAFVSFDDLDLFTLMDPAIAVISQDVKQMGTAAVKILLALMRGEKPTSQRIPTQFITRRSIGETQSIRSKE